MYASHHIITNDKNRPLASDYLRTNCVRHKALTFHPVCFTIFSSLLLPVSLSATSAYSQPDSRTISCMSALQCTAPANLLCPARPAPHRVVLQGSRLLPAPPDPALSSLELRHLGRDTIAGLIAGILQKYGRGEPGEQASFVEIALAEEEESGGSRPVTALRRPAQNSWEAFNHTEEMTQASHTAMPSLPLPDSLNEFEGEEYQSPAVFQQDSLGNQRGQLARLGSPQDVDSLQFPVSPVPAPPGLASPEPPDSLIAVQPSKTKITPTEFFDSITSLEKPKSGASLQKRRIIPYCDNSLSSGTSAFTSQDVSFDSKDSSPSDTDRARQVRAFLSCYIKANFILIGIFRQSTMLLFHKSNYLTNYCIEERLASYPTKSQFIGIEALLPYLL